MTKLKYLASKKVRLKDLPQFSEQWLHDVIAEDPSIIGLGDLALIERERRQEKAGRLDMLLANPQGSERYEVEVMLGATDESHIIRCIEYWDIERRRYPGYEHYAVLIAEDITSRFLNLMGLFVGTIPLIAIQLDVLQINESIALDFVKVIDKTRLRRDDMAEVKLQATDRAYWENRTTAKLLQIVDEISKWIAEAYSGKLELNYNKHYIGFAEHGRANNVVTFRPLKKFMHLNANVQDIATVIDELENAGLGVSEDSRASDRVKVTFNAQEFAAHKDLIKQLVLDAVGML